MRHQFQIVFAILITALGLCSVIAMHSRKAIGKPVALLIAALIPPVMGNLLIVHSYEELISEIGYYIYFIGMDLVMYALAVFTTAYCKGAGRGQGVPKVVYVLLLGDTVQLLLNPVFGHAFDTEPIMVDGAAYYRLVPHLGQTFHRLVCYGIFTAVLLIFVLMVVRATRVYAEKYVIVLGTMIVAGLWQTFYIFSRTPIDRSMIGFAVFGILIFYFSLYYRPLRLLDRMLSNIAAEMPEALFVFDPNGICVWANEQGCQLAGVDSGALDRVSEQLTQMFGDPGEDTEQHFIERVIGSGEDARYYTLEEQKVKDAGHKLTGSYLRIRDVTEERLRRKRELYNATHDRLTGLYTREYLYQQIAEVLEAHPETEYLVIFVDVKDFKVVNDIFGSDFGDHALRCLSDWVRGDMTPRCRYGRLAGDTFGVFVPKEEFDPERLEEELANFTVKTPKAEYHLLVHLGVYAVDPADRDVSVMFDRAHLSLATIKDAYNTHIAYYDNEIRKQILWNQEISAQLPGAIHRREVRPYLQPIADSSGKIVGAEALARWIHPEYGFLSPAAFIPAFEKNGMIVEVDKHMWRSACEILRRWEPTHPDLFLSVNISPRDFYFLDVVSEIKGLVKEYGVSPARLRIEITETVMMNDVDTRMQLLEDFRRSGFILEMDDFGSGYSSLNMLKDMPVDVLKIDMKFLGRTDDIDKAHTIVKNIIRLSRELGIASLTEGVETQEQYRFLSGIGCKLFQGYYFAKPMPVEEFERFAGFAEAEAEQPARKA